MNFYKHYIGDFQRGTGHLSLTERGAYLCLIHHYYATEKPLPKDLDALCRIAGAVSKIERDAVKVAIGFFVPVESGLMSARIEAELEKAGETSSTNRDIALAREAKRRAEKQARTEHEQSTKRAQSVPRKEHETDTDGAPTRHQTPDAKVNREPLVSAVPLSTGGTPAGMVCARLKSECRISSGLNPQHPKLLALLAAGLTADEIVSAGMDANGKGFAWVLATAEGRRREAANVTTLPERAASGRLTKAGQRTVEAAARWLESERATG